MWDYNNVTHVNIEISSLCNSICAWCPRYENMSPVVNRQLSPQYVTIGQFKKWFPVSFTSKVIHWTYSGDYGDAGTNPDLIEIFRYTFNCNPLASVQVNTNGGMKSSEFWKEIGELFAEYPQRKIIFSIDGLEDTNHIYRRNVKWDKVYQNATAYLRTGAIGIWEALVFQYNQHQTEEMKSLADEMGFSEIIFKTPQGFEGGPIKVRDKNQIVLYEIHPTDTSQIQKPHIKLNGKRAEDLDYATIKVNVESNYKDSEGDTKCFSMRNGENSFEIRVTSWGAVYPCSHFGHLSLYPREHQQIQKAQMIDLFKDKKISLKENTLKEILDSDPFNSIYSSWKEKSCLTCWMNCGESVNKQSTMQKIYNNQ
jgi:MoaA/NifB/PqqE/SkfB family radical SAM enzyme